MYLKTCCFTGPRPKNYPWGNDESRLMLVTQKLEAAVREAVSCGYRHFICGMAAGIDLLAAEIVLRLKAEGESISLEAALPFPEQPARWNKETREQYARILEQCDLVNVIAPSFSLEAYAARDSEMVERSSLVIAVEGQPYGGTARTIAYAKQLRRKIILISGAGSDAPNMVHTKLYHKDRQLREGIMEETQEKQRGIGTRIQICNKKNAVTFWGCRNGEAVFCLKTRKGDKNRVTLNGNIVTVNDYKRYPLTPEQLERFQSAKEEFDRDYEAAQRGEKFMRVERGGEVRYIRRDRKNSYTFIEVHADGTVLWRKGSVEEYLRSFDFLMFVDQLHSLGLDREKQKKEEEELLLLTNDDYIVREVKYLRGEATEEDLKVLERQDRKLRFLPKKEVYDVCDIEFVSFKKQHQCPLHPSLWYDMIVKIDGREYMAVYGWKHETMRILGCPTDIRITPEVFEYSDDFIVIFPNALRQDIQDQVKCIFDIKNYVSANGRLELQLDKTKCYYYEKDCLNEIQSDGSPLVSQNQHIDFLGFSFDGKDVDLRKKTADRNNNKIMHKARRIQKMRGFIRRDGTVVRVSFKSLLEYSSKNYTSDIDKNGNERRKPTFNAYLKRSLNIFKGEPLLKSRYVNCKRHAVRLINRIIQKKKDAEKN